MNEAVTDILWQHFEPLWASWVAMLPTNPPMVAGGYGLFLKQRWLLANQDNRIVIPLSRWRSPIPRATKDFDLVIGLDLLLNSQAQKSLVELLAKHHFSVTEKHPRWQFEKSLEDGRRILVELHAAPPAGGHPDLKEDRVRIKRKKSLKNLGVHARRNPEAIGHELHPTTISLDGAVVTLPNPITWLIMKLTASEDCQEDSRNPAYDEEKREFSRKQSIKHANDAYRIVAMLSEAERGSADVVADTIKGAPSFVRASSIYASSFADDRGWAQTHLSEYWEQADIGTIRSLLSTWLPRT